MKELEATQVVDKELQARLGQQVLRLLDQVEERCVKLAIGIL